jgi:lipoprotein NlpI
MQCSYKSERFDAANIEACSRLLLENDLSRDERAVTLNIRGSTYLALGQPYDAIDDHEEALRIWPENVSAHARRGVALLNVGRYKEASESFDKSLLRAPGINGAPEMCGRGIALSYLGQVDAAKKEISAALKSSPSACDQYEELGIKPSFEG